MTTCKSSKNVIKGLLMMRIFDVEKYFKVQHDNAKRQNLTGGFQAKWI